MGKRRAVDATELQSIRVGAINYIERQLAVMEKFNGKRPALSDAQYEKLIADVSKPAIEIRRWES